MKVAARMLLLGLAGGALVPTAAQASEQTYRIDSNSSYTVNLNICSSSVYLVADGDGDTDLDFWVYDNNGNRVHTDTDTTDITYYTISSNAGGGRCLPYRLEVQNLGNVYNNMKLTLTDQGGSGGQTGLYADTGRGGGRVTTQQVRSEADSNQTYTLNLCAPSVFMEVRGDEDTDLDFWVYDERGNEVHSDTDQTDFTFATLNTGRGYGNCAAYRLRIRNYGNVYNNVTVTLTEQ